MGRSTIMEGSAQNFSITKWDIERLIAELGHKDVKNRIVVIMELGRRKDVSAIEGLTKLVLNDLNSEIRGHAILAMGKIALGALRKDLEKDIGISSDTMSMLGNMYSTFELVMAPLKSLLYEGEDVCIIHTPISDSIRIVKEEINQALREAKTG
ncbi:MAG: HEAT repeat domain-containing protein [Candidatus Micrarchaeota archaeon]